MQKQHVLVLLAVAVGACARTKPGTHVEIIDDGGKTYVAGAAGPGMNEGMACRAAVGRAVAAIALKFSQENDDLGDDVADEVGAEDGDVFLQGFAKADAQRAAVQDKRFDPGDHLCFASVRWRPPVFVKEAVLRYAQELKAAETQPQQAAAPSSPENTGSTSAPTAQASSPAASQPPPPPVSVAPPAPRAPAPAAPQCKSEKKTLAKTLAGSQKALDDLAECKRRTGGDETICHRYVLYVDEAKKKEADVARDLCKCLNGGLSATLRQALFGALPNHAGVAVETRADGTLILWAYAPLERTAFALEVAPDGAARGTTPLAANQVQWLKQQLGL